MHDEKIETRLNIDPENIRTTKFIEPRYSQPCMLCDNTREIPHPRFYEYPWVCDECKEAIAFVKEFRSSLKEVSSEKSKEIEASIALL